MNCGNFEEVQRTLEKFGELWVAEISSGKMGKLWESCGNFKKFREF